MNELPKQSVELIRATLVDMRKHGLMSGLPQEHAFTLLEEIEYLTRDRDLWKERHDRERAAHANNLTEQQKVEAERDRLRVALRYWLPDETMIPAGHEVAWNEHVALIPEHRPSDSIGESHDQG